MNIGMEINVMVITIMEMMVMITMMMMVVMMTTNPEVMKFDQ